MSRIATWAEVEPGMFVHDNISTKRVEAVGADRVRLTERDGTVSTPRHGGLDSEVRIVYEVTEQQATELIERVLEGTEIPWTS